MAYIPSPAVGSATQFTETDAIFFALYLVYMLIIVQITVELPLRGRLFVSFLPLIVYLILF